MSPKKLVRLAVYDPVLRGAVINRKAYDSMTDLGQQAIILKEAIRKIQNSLIESSHHYQAAYENMTDEQAQNLVKDFFTGDNNFSLDNFSEYSGSLHLLAKFNVTDYQAKVEKMCSDLELIAQKTKHLEIKIAAQNYCASNGSQKLWGWQSLIKLRGEVFSYLFSSEYIYSTEEVRTLVEDLDSLIAAQMGDGFKGMTGMMFDELEGASNF